LLVVLDSGRLGEPPQAGGLPHSRNQTNPALLIVLNFNLVRGVTNGRTIGKI